MEPGVRDNNGEVQVTTDSDRVGDSIRIDGGGGTRSIVGEVIAIDQQLLSSGGNILVESEGIKALCERQELAFGVCFNVKDSQTSSDGSAQSRVNL